MQKIITIAGWGQSPNSLDCLSSNAQHLDYNKFDNISFFFKSIEGTQCDVLIGWSLGGQLALRAIECGAIKANKLVLIATPFQFVADDKITNAASKTDFAKMIADYKNDPQLFLKQFNPFIAFGDSKQKKISKHLMTQNYSPNYENLEYYLQELGNFKCNSLSFANMPKTYIIHGKCDHVVDFLQSQLFLDKIKNSELLAVKNCAHAPHLHDETIIKAIL